MTFDTAPEPNRGGPVSDVVPDGPERQQSLEEWKKQRNCDENEHVRLVKLAHMRYRHPDLGAITEFLQGIYLPIKACARDFLLIKLIDAQRPDFGMYVAKRTETEIWLRGYGPDPFVCKFNAPALSDVAHVINSPVDFTRLCLQRREKVPGRCLHRRIIPRPRASQYS